MLLKLKNITYNKTNFFLCICLYRGCHVVTRNIDTQCVVFKLPNNRDENGNIVT